MNFITLKTIALFEAKTLVRGWLFKIFAVLSVLVVSIINVAYFTNSGGASAGYVIAGSVPYINILILNFIQAIIAIFLSSDFIGRDKKLDTTEAFYARSISNFSYVVGKTLGICMVFLFLNLFILLIGLAFNISNPDVIIVPVTYLIYPLLISLPTVILVLGLSFFLMTLIKNQAVTFILMLGILGAGLFYLGNKWFNVLDFIGMNTPMTYSVFIGLPDVANLLLVRGSYILFGVGFIFFTILMLPRLPQEKHFKKRAVTGMALAFIPAVIMISTYLIRNNNDEKMRADILKLEETLPTASSLKITDNHISLIHSGKSVSVSSKLTAIVENNNLSLILNSGFDVKSVKINGKETSFERNLHTILLKADNILPDELIEIEVIYSGSPNDKSTFPEIPEETRIQRVHREVLCMGKQLSFISHKYILFTAEADWYPVAASSNYRSYRQFTNFTLDVEISSNLTAFSQGKMETDGKGKFNFTSQNPLKALSLTAGNYTTRSLIVDSVEITLAMYPKHLKIIENYFNEIVDTIPALISDMKGDFERKLDLSYPFERFSLIEVPINFFTYPRNWTLATDDNMPEILLIAERGGGSRNYDTKMQEQWIQWGNRRNDGKELLRREILFQVFKNIIGEMIFSTTETGRMQNSNLRDLFFWNKHSVFPQYTTNAYSIEQEDFPAIQFIIENYLFSRLQTTGAGGAQVPMIFEDVNSQIILKLKDNTLPSLLDKLKNDSRLANLVSRKGKELFEIIKLNIEPQDIDQILNDIINGNRFKSMSVNYFTQSLDLITNKNISQLIDNWLNNDTYPAFLFGETRVSNIKEDNRERFFVRIPVVNNGTGSGILTVGIREGERQRVMMRGQARGPGGGNMTFRQEGGMPAPLTMEKTYEIPAGQSMEIGIMLDSEPREIIINTYIAQNLPTTRRIMINNINEEKITGFEGIRPFSGVVSTSQPNEYVVDNEDEGFSVTYRKETKTLKDWWMARNIETTGDKYSNIIFWQPSHKWQFILGDFYYGNYIKSAVYIRKGTGENNAEWKTELNESGHYSVYVYLPQMPQRRTFRQGREDTESGSYIYTITHDEGEDVVTVDIGQNTGWYWLGDFYISKGNASVTLSDKTDRRIVIADAVKWVKR